MEENFLNIGAIAYNKFELNHKSGTSLMLLLDKVEELSHPMSYDELLSEIMEAARHIMKTEASSLMLLDDEQKELRVVTPTGPVSEEIRGKTLPKDKGFAGWVVQHKIPLIVNNVQQQQELFGGELSRNFQSRNLICAPLLNNQRDVIGVIQAVNRIGDSAFEEEDMSVFQALANHAARAIERHRSQRQMDSRLQEKDLMLSELHHRMKNNLSLLTGLIEMEEIRLKDNGAREILKNIQARIKSINAVYELLSERGAFEDVEMGPYLTRIIDGVTKALSDSEREIRVEANIDDITLHPKQALPCGLIVNELLVNSYKHAFRHKNEGLIVIDLAKYKGSVSLTYKDDGLGLPEDFDPQEYASLGFKILRALVNKLSGTLDFERNNGRAGLHATLEFPLEEKVVL